MLALQCLQVKARLKRKYRSVCPILSLSFSNYSSKAYHFHPWLLASHPADQIRKFNDPQFYHKKTQQHELCRSPFFLNFFRKRPVTTTQIPPSLTGMASQQANYHKSLIRMDGDGPKDWTMLDFQGAIVPREEGCSLDGQSLGHLARKGERGAILTIGNQRLDGKIVELKQPLAIMKRSSSRNKDVCEEMETDAASVCIPTAQEEFVIVGLIKKKIVFSHR